MLMTPRAKSPAILEENYSPATEKQSFKVRENYFGSPCIQSLTDLSPPLLQTAEADDVARRRAVFAFSALLRNFPAAQRSFLALGGPKIFSPAFEVRMAF